MLSSVLLCLLVCYSLLTLPRAPYFPPRYVWSRVYRMFFWQKEKKRKNRLKLCQRVWIGFEHGKESVKKSLSLSLSLSRTQSHTHTHTHLKDKAGDILYFFISLTNPMNAAIYLKKTKTHDIRRRCTGWHVPEYSLKVVPANLPCLSDMSSFITMNFGHYMVKIPHTKLLVL